MPFCRRHFQIHFLESKIVVFSFNIQLVSITSISSRNGLAPNRRQAIIWTNNGQVYWRRYASLGYNELNSTCVLVTFCEQGVHSTNRVFLQWLQFDRKLFCNNVITTTVWTLLDADYQTLTRARFDQTGPTWSIVTAQATVETAELLTHVPTPAGRPSH